jgi:hypothetical protein
MLATNYWEKKKSQPNKPPGIHRSSFHAISIMFWDDRFPFNHFFSERTKDKIATLHKIQATQIIIVRIQFLKICDDHISLKKVNAHPHSHVHVWPDRPDISRKSNNMWTFSTKLRASKWWRNNSIRDYASTSHVRGQYRVKTWNNLLNTQSCSYQTPTQRHTVFCWFYLRVYILQSTVSWDLTRTEVKSGRISLSLPFQSTVFIIHRMIYVIWNGRLSRLRAKHPFHSKLDSVDVNETFTEWFIFDHFTMAFSTKGGAKSDDPRSDLKTRQDSGLPDHILDR